MVMDNFTILKDLAKLRTLSVSIHDLVGIPEEIKALNELSLLYLYNGNSLEVKEVVEAIINMSKIETVKFYGNDFSQAEKDFLFKELGDLELKM